MFGPEFTFSDPTVTPDDFDAFRIYDFLNLVKIRFIQIQPEGSKFLIEGDWIISPNNWAFYTSTDPGVVEVNTDPLTVAKFEKYAVEMQDAIFGSAARIGLYPQPFLGGGHINIDFEYLRRRPLLFRNFLADLLVNHAELFMGIFGFDTNNALPLIMSSKSAFAAIARAFEAFDTGSDPDLNKLEELIAAIEDIITSFDTDPYMEAWHGENDLQRSEKYYSVRMNLKEDSASTIELRGVRPQKSMDVWIRQIRLLRNRLRYLDRLNVPVPLKLPFNIDKSFPRSGKVSKKQMLNPPISARTALKNFKIFVEESGETIEDHLDYVWPDWHSNAKVAEFILENGLGCEELLKGLGD